MEAWSFSVAFWAPTMGISPVINGFSGAASVTGFCWGALLFRMVCPFVAFFSWCAVNSFLWLPELFCSVSVVSSVNSPVHWSRVRSLGKVSPLMSLRSMVDCSVR